MFVVGHFAHDAHRPKRNKTLFFFGRNGDFHGFP